MPVDPRLGKMLILAILLNCLDPIVTIASAMGGGKSIFRREEGKEGKERMVRRGGEK